MVGTHEGKCPQYYSLRQIPCVFTRGNWFQGLDVLTKMGQVKCSREGTGYTLFFL